jgi:hypothetical protein
VRVAVGKSVGVAVSVGVGVGVRVGRGVRLGGSVACDGVSLGVGVGIGVSVGSGVARVAVEVALGTCAPFVPGASVISLISCGGGGGVVGRAQALISNATSGSKIRIGFVCCRVCCITFGGIALAVP